MVQTVVCLLEGPTHYLQFYGGQGRYSLYRHTSRLSTTVQSVVVRSAEIAAGFTFAGLGWTISSWIPLWGPGDEKIKSHLTSLVELDFDNGWLLDGKSRLTSGSVFFHPALWRAWRAHHATAPGARVDRFLGSFSIRCSREKRRPSVFGIRLNLRFGHKCLLVFAIV